MKKEIAKLCVSFALLMGGIATSGTVSLILCIAAFLLCGAEVVINAVKNILSGEFLDECFLMSLASVAAFLTGQYTEAVAIMLFYGVGELFCDHAKER